MQAMRFEVTRRALVVGLVLGSRAHAGPGPITVTLTGGVGFAPQVRGLSYTDDNADEVDVAALAVGWRLPGHVAVGLRVGIATTFVIASTRRIQGADDDYLYTTRPLDVAGLAHYDLGRAWLEPWLGVHVDRTDTLDETCHSTPTDRTCEPVDAPVAWTHMALAYGLTAGIDLLHSTPVKIAMYLAAQGSVAGYNTGSLGIALRY